MRNSSFFNPKTIQRPNNIYIGLHVKYLLLLSIFNYRNLSQQFLKNLELKIFYENSIGGILGVNFGLTDERETDIWK
jgi:hypothetical protein